MFPAPDDKKITTQMQGAKVYLYPNEIDPAKNDVIVLDDGTAAKVTASYPFGETRWAVEIPGQIVQLDPTKRVRVQRPL